MPVILVVDDSKIDRILVTDLLTRELADWTIEVVDSAEQALVSLRDMVVDVIVTDMLMPGMSGLELIECIHRQPRKVPVIVISGNDDNSNEVRALRQGAACYVSKAELADRLGTTVKQVLAANQSAKIYHELIDRVDEICFRLQLENDPSTISDLVTVTQQLAVSMKLCGDEGRTRLGIAIEEAVINAMYHGNLQLPASDVVEIRRRLRDGEAVEAIESRRWEKPYVDRSVHVKVVLSRSSFEITVRDEGDGFAPQEVEHDNRHRGLKLIKNLVDEVSFNEKGTEIRLLKHREETPHELTIPID
jgi:CheY-like chemotaxis protein/anti-sigma regulatory factor (Ser/Thr protein kinase)